MTARSVYGRTFGLAIGTVLLSAATPTSAVASTIIASGSIVQYSILTSGYYTITAVGGSGGVAGPGMDYTGGLGGELAGTVYLPGGTVLNIVAGSAGGVGSGAYGGGGGGASYVWIAETIVPLLVAPGGGGAGLYGGGFGVDTSNSGKAIGGGGASCILCGGGGAGWSGSGEGLSGVGSPDGGIALMYGGSGGGIAGLTTLGGFGGGGGVGSGDPGPVLGGGGGGGYQGGDGGGYPQDGGYQGDPGYGGTFYIDPSFSGVTEIVNGPRGNGWVSIELNDASVPEPATFATLAVGLAALGMVARRGQRRR